MFALVDLFAPGYIYENIGLYRLYAYLKKCNINTNVFHIFTNSEESEFDRLSNELSKYDVVGFSTYHSTVQCVDMLCRKIKKLNPNCYTVIGSKFVTGLADKLIDELDSIDAISMGDGEFALEYIHKMVLEGKIDEIGHHVNIMTKDQRRGKQAANLDVSLLPWPERNVKIINRMSYATILTTNKCVGQCAFCITRTNNCDNHIYFRQADDVVNELNHIYKTTKNRFFFIVDGSFEDPGILGKQKIMSYVNALKNNDIGYSFVAYIKADSFKTKDDVELLKSMRSVGINQLFIGIESGNEDDLKLYNKRAKLEDNYRIINILNDIDIHPIYGFIFLNPYSTPERLAQNYQFLSKVNNFQMSRYVIHLGVYENTPIFYQMKDDGLINSMYSYTNVYGYNFVNKDVEAISKFIKPHFLDNDIYQSEVNFFNFIHYYYSQKVIYRNIIQSYEERWKSIQEKFYNLHNIYFGKIYQNMDINYAETKYGDYSKSLQLLYNDVNNLKMKIMVKVKREEN